MKRVIIICLIIVASVASVNAQYFIEGDIGVSYDKVELSGSGIPDGTHHNKPNYDAYISPQIGYWLNNKVALGIRVPLYYRINHSIADYGNEEYLISKRTEPTFGFYVFGRYKLFEKGKFSVLLDSPVGFSVGKVKSKNKLNTRTESTSTISVNVFPSLSYNLNERFSIIAVCDFLNLGFYSYTIKNKDTDTKRTGSSFGFNTRSKLFSSLSDIKIGFVYNF